MALHLKIDERGSIGLWISFLHTCIFHPRHRGPHVCSSRLHPFIPCLIYPPVSDEWVNMPIQKPYYTTFQWYYVILYPPIKYHKFYQYYTTHQWAPTPRAAEKLDANPRESKGHVGRCHRAPEAHGGWALTSWMGQLPQLFRDVTVIRG